MLFLIAFFEVFSMFYFSGTSCPPFKIVILDEADSMTTAAQVKICK